MSQEKPAISSGFTSINGINIHYLYAGEGNPIVLLHGIPTYSYLWRNIIGPLSAKGRVLAPDLPGYGLSDKPVDAPYTTDFFTDALNGFIDALGLDKISLVVHDLGGPVGMLWAVNHVDRVERIVILNTLVYPHFSLSMKLLLLSARIPGLRNWLSGLSGIAYTMKWGVYNLDVMTPELISSYQAPFKDINTRHAYIKTLTAMKPDILTEIVPKLIKMNQPIHLVCGEKDNLLSGEMHQLKKYLPEAGYISINDCGHFVPEDQTEKLLEVLTELFA
ncbi:MAG TPA: alpha/beta fold hydrolase [Syntrophomonadaceae bacterium]|nr:alpha/beta fold hydrolase [Syntrophomonadaceae bacterium]